MPTDEELEAAVAKAVEKANKDAEIALKKAVEAAKDGKFTQEDLDRIAGESRKAGREVAEKELLKEIGVEDREALKASLKAAKDLEDSQKTELQKAQEEAAKLREEAESAKSEAKNSRIQTALELKIRDAGINPERASAAMRLVDLSKLDVTGTEVSGLDEAVSELKSTSPEWFGAKISPPDASGSGGGATDFKTASADDRDKALEKYGVKI
jgi:hypothetical protein